MEAHFLLLVYLNLSASCLAFLSRTHLFEEEGNPFDFEMACLGSAAHTWVRQIENEGFLPPKWWWCCCLAGDYFSAVQC